MSVRIEAIYERGVLRPIKPLDLTEGEQVEMDLVTLSEVEARRLSKAERDAREIEIINRNIDELSAEAWDALSYQVEL
ncbi:MAG: antitoxin family protein [Acidobacteriota bacterium]|nr:antitoxin family protein [Acidobacteriota bacterium]